MKTIFAFIFAASISTAAPAAKEVYRCETPGRTFKVFVNSKGEYQAVLQDFTRLPKTYSCKRTARGNNFKCTQDKYIITVRTNAHNQKVVEFELEGDFWPDSGYLFSLTCNK